MDWLQLEVAHAAFPPYGLLVEKVVLPNFTLFAWLIFLAELVVGLSLLTGAFTRIGALLGLAMAVNLGIGLLEVPGEMALELRDAGDVARPFLCNGRRACLRCGQVVEKGEVRQGG